MPVSRQALSDASRPLDHLYVTDRAANENLTRGGQGNPKIRPVEHRAHGLAIRGELESAFSAADEVRHAAAMDASELEALGTIIVLEGADAAYPLKVESLDHFSAHRTTPKRPMW